MEDLEEKIGRYILNIKVQRNNIDCIFGIVRLKDKLCDLLIRAEKEIDADFAQDLFINYIKTEKVFRINSRKTFLLSKNLFSYPLTTY